MDDEQTTPSAKPAAAARAGTALCLSGGGFRAALFHLGATRRLNELGVLSSLDAISAVSGGSIFAAHLADRLRPWPAPGEVVPDWEGRVAAPFRAFTSHNLRTIPLLRQMLPWHWANLTIAVETLAAAYARRLTRLTLPELPERPRIVFSATEMNYGVNWIFERSRIGDFQAGYRRPAPPMPVGQAVAASSAFPPFFPPMVLHFRPDQLTGGDARGAERNEIVGQITLTDGGDYDNMALEPVWKQASAVLVSDGGATFEIAMTSNPLLRLLRYGALLGRQAESMRKRWLMASTAKGGLHGTYWGIASAPVDYDAAPGYPPDLVRDVIARIRTDMDAFSEAEAAVLENHGYLLADAALHRYAASLIARQVPLAIPHPDWMDEARVRQALATSHHRSILGRW